MPGPGDPAHGAYILRDKAKELLKYVDKYGRKFRQDVPETSLDRYEIALAKIVKAVRNCFPSSLKARATTVSATAHAGDF